MARIHIHQRKDGSHGLYAGKRCLAYGSRTTIYTIGRAIRKRRKSRQ
jgi:hypothetical protein